MTNKKILLLEQELPKISVPNMDRWFLYAMVENAERAANAGKKIREVIKPKVGMQEYQGKLKALQTRYGEKDKHGKIVLEVKDLGNGAQMEKVKIPSASNPKSPFSKAFQALEKRYKKHIEEYNEGLKFLDEENDLFEPHLIQMDLVPHGLSTQEFKIIFNILEKPKKKKTP